MSIIEKKASTTPATPPSGYVHWFVTSTGQPQYVDESGIVRNFLGPTGPTGPTGAIGATGATGPAGATGPTGPGTLNVVTNFGIVANDPTKATANVTAWNAMLATLPTNSVIYFPAGGNAFYFDAALTIPTGKKMIVRSDGSTRCTILTTSATADIISCQDSNQDIRNLNFASTATRTAGYAVNANGNPYISVAECQFIGMWSAINYGGNTANAGVQCTIDSCVFVDCTNDPVTVDGPNASVFMNACGITCTTPGTTAHGVHVTQCSFMLVNGCGVNGGQYGIYVAPDTSAKTVNQLVITNSSLDANTVCGAYLTGVGKISRTKFENVSLSNGVTGVTFNGTGTTLPSATDFITCDFMNNSSRGIYVQNAQDITINSCRFAANTTAAVDANAATGSVTKLILRNNTIGPTAGYAGNGIGIDFNAGTYAAYQIVGNDVRGNTIGIQDDGSVASPELRVVRDNIGHLVSGAVGSIPANVVQTGTTETVVMSARVLPYAVQVGTTFRIRACGTTTTAGGAPTLRVRAGSAGTTADTAGWANASGTNPGVNTPIQGEWLCTVKSVGSSGTVIVEGWGINALGTMQRGPAAPLSVTVNTTATWYIDFTSVMSGAGVNTWTNGVIEVI